MQTLRFVIGATATGKSYFINANYAQQDVVILNVYDYQQRVYNEEGLNGRVPLNIESSCLMKANNMLLEDIINQLKAGRDVVVEQTFYKAKRRITYIEAIRAAIDVAIEVYVMSPTESRWRANIDRRELGWKLEGLMRQAADIEFPNPSEGFDKIYEVVDGVVTLRMEQPRPEIVVRAKEELDEETRRIKEKEEARQKRKQLVESMNTRPFWHYCEACGRTAYITAQEAADNGWRYPPRNNRAFGRLSPRTCGSCKEADTLYIKVMKQTIPIVSETALTPEELKTWRRIKAEPESLLTKEDV